ncbi:adenine-specific methyltransferase EcoRI family protein, partial [Eubacterium sp.]|uniref:adenine-specific methyltransferase EcoRI family protein n=1 Tax=Eubacterium sp. TaxID=142586 RepID=UPI00258371E7
SDGRRFIRVKGVRWYTNMDYKARHKDLETTYLYSKKEQLYPDLYPKYENYDAINIDKTAEIPMDYYGVMGVPITFMDKYNPDQFIIVGMCENLDLYGLKTRFYTSEECHKRYFELFGKKGNYDLNAAGVINGRKTYQRILIKRKDGE